MANTVIQLKWSNVSAAPATLNVGEAAYSNTSQKLFIGDSSNNVITVGGKFYVDQQGLIFTKTNVAFDAANSAGSYANAAFTFANTNAGAAAAGSYANAAFTTANSAQSYANSAFLAANTPSYVANSAASYANAAFATANTVSSASSYANSGFAVANSASSYANAAFGVANTASASGTSAGSYANSGFAVANSAGSYANSAYTRANNSINANTGGTITADLVITGNLTVQGNTTYVDTRTITSGDSLIHLANNNTVGDTVDIGFYGSYNSGGVKYTGLVRQAGANYFLFKDLTSDPTANVLAPGSLTAANTGTLTANLTAYSVTIGGQDIQLFATNAYTQANTGVTNAAAASSYANAAFGVANTASSAGTSAGAYANAAFATANTVSSASSYANSGFAVANSAASYANSAFLSANTPSYVANSAASYANAAFSVANTASSTATSAGSYANSAFAKANTDFTNISISAGDFGGAGIVPTFHITANGRIDSVSNVSIALAASQITSGTLDVARGGTGAGTFTVNGVLLGNGTGAFNTAASSTEGHILTINASGVPTFAMLSGGTF